MSGDRELNLCDTCLLRLFNKTPGCVGRGFAWKLSPYGLVVECKDYHQVGSINQPEKKHSEGEILHMYVEKLLNSPEDLKVVSGTILNIFKRYSEEVPDETA